MVGRVPLLVQALAVVMATECASFHSLVVLIRLVVGLIPREGTTKGAINATLGAIIAI